MIPIGEPVLICAKHKKSLIEVERYENDYNEIIVTTLWRNGEFQITCEGLAEARLLEEYFNCKEGKEINLYEEFSDVEMHGTFDGISVDFDGDCEELEEAQENDEDFYYSTWLEENGYEHVDTEYFIYGPVAYA